MMMMLSWGVRDSSCLFFFSIFPLSLLLTCECLSHSLLSVLGHQVEMGMIVFFFSDSPLSSWAKREGNNSYPFVFPLSPISFAFFLWFRLYHYSYSSCPVLFCFCAFFCQLVRHLVGDDTLGTCHGNDWSIGGFLLFCARVCTCG